FLLLILLGVFAITAGVLAEQGIRDDSAAAYLEFENVLDGRCYILSEGGKLTLLRNKHPSKSINYRLLRVFANKGQGLITGIVPANGATQKLGCDKVDRRPQTWRVDRARFIEE
ncbi:MAG: hypothetical protein ACREXT_02920, partial [Gammaproteobacteria bacterium]